MIYRYGLAFLFTWFLLGSTATAQENGKSASSTDVYARLPQPQQAMFRETLFALIQLEKSGDWEAVYEQFYDNEGASTKESFVKERQHLRVLAFRPTAVAYIPPSELWMVEGCAQFAPPLLGHKGGVVSVFHAKLIEGKWRFSAPPGIAIHQGRESVKSCDVASK